MFPSEIIGGFSPSFLLFYHFTSSHLDHELCTFSCGLDDLIEDPQELVCAPGLLAISYQYIPFERYTLSRSQALYHSRPLMAQRTTCSSPNYRGHNSNGPSDPATQCRKKGTAVIKLHSVLKSIRVKMPL